MGPQGLGSSQTGAKCEEKQKEEEKVMSNKVSEESTRLRKHSVLIAGHRTSISLEEAFWRQLHVLSKTQNKSLNQLVTEIDATRTQAGRGNLSSAIRVYILEKMEGQND